jgi:uncharacterized repeat protein (TIGR01451 family)
MITKKRYLYIMVFLITALIATVTVSENSFAKPPDTFELMEKAVSKGEVNVIVGLKLPKAFKPEGHLSGNEVAEQRKAIAATKHDLLDKLTGHKAKHYASWESLPYVALKVDVSALDYLGSSPLVTTIQEDGLSKPYLQSTTEHIGADVTWSAGFGGLGQTVVILDTGIDRDHPFYGGDGMGGVGRVVTEACFSAGAGNVSLCPNGANTQTGPGSADATTAQCLNGAVNLCAHGSHVAGIAAGRDPAPPNNVGYSGVAPEANIIAIQVFTRFNNDGDCGGPGTAPCVKTYDSDNLSGLDYINTTLRLSWPISSANMSLGGGMHTSACDGDARKAAIDNLLSNNIATCIASGNDGWTDALGAPGCISTAVTVGAVYDGNPCHMPDEVTYNMHALVDLLAVGRCVDSSVPDNAWGLGWGGTSMATPQVTGAFAVIKAIDPSMSAADILSLLQTTGVLVTDTRAPNPPGSPAGHVKPRIQLDAAIAKLTNADLQVFKECKPDDPISVGDTATCTITVTNWGPDPAINITITDRHVSNGMFSFGTVTATAGTCVTTTNPQNGTGTVTCTLMSLAPNASVTIKVPVTATTPQDINDTVTVSSLNDTDTSNNVATGTVKVRDTADLMVTKDCKPDDFVLAGDAATCTIWVDNLGPSTANNVKLVDAFVANSIFSFGTVTTTAGTCTPTPNPQNGSGNVNCDLGNIVSGGRVTVVVPVSASEAMDINDVATVSSDNADPNPNNNKATDHITVKAKADLQSFSVFAAEVQVNGLPGKIIDTNALPSMPDLLCCNFGGTNVTAGRRIEWQTSTTNTGPSKAENVRMEVLLPFGASVIENTLNPQPSPGGKPGRCSTEPAGELRKKVICQYGTLEKDETAALRFQVLIAPDLPSGTQLSFDSSSSSDQFDPNLSNNKTSIQFDVNTWADMSTTKKGVGKVLTGYNTTSKQYIFTETENQVSAGSSILKYTISAQNNGPSNAMNVTVKDTLPAGVKFVRPANGADCQSDQVNQNVLYCSLGNMAAGSKKTFDIYVSVDPSLSHGSSLVNTALALDSSSSDMPFGPMTNDPCNSTSCGGYNNNQSTQNTTVYVDYDLSIKKTSDADTYKPSSTVKYTITVVNNGPSDVDSVTVTDNLPTPKQAKYLWDNGGCNWNGAKTLTCNLGAMAPGETRQFDVYVTIFGSRGTVSNTAYISSGASPYDVYSTNNTSTRTIIIQGTKFMK